MRVSVLALLTAILVLAATAPARADALRCGSKLVTTGDTRGKVRQMCGEPTDVQTRSILRQPFYNLHGRRIFYSDALIEVPVEIWTYNFGPYKLMRQIRFVDGRVEDIDSLGYGYHGTPPTDTFVAPRETYR